MRGALILALAFALLPGPVLAAEQFTVVQNGREFHPSEISIHAGDTLVFQNKDEFIHQIYVDSPLINYDSKEQPPGQTLSITFPISGTFDVRCHIHPKMLLVVHVK